MVLGGTVDLQIDDKGRIRIPGKFRPFFADCKQIFLQKGNGCLELIKDSKYNEVMGKLSSVSMMGGGPLYEAFVLYSSSTSAINEDSQGRFTIPAAMKEFAHIAKDVRFVGLFDRLQIWDRDTFVSRFEQNSDSYANALAEIDKLLNGHD